MWFAYLFAILPLITWWSTGLFDLDEGYYGAVVAEMNRRGEWITPYYNGSPWFEKPILLYWLAKPCFAIFGPWIGARLPSVLCTVALYAICARFARRNMGEWQARHVVYCLGTSLLVLALGRLMMTDSMLNLAMTGAFLAFYESLTSDASRVRSRVAVGFWIGAAILAKGPVALLLFGPIAVLTYALNPNLRGGFRGGWIASSVVMVATVSSWYVPCYLANGDVFVQRFLIEQNIGRFTGGDAAHSLGFAGLPFYIPILLLAVIPWGFTEAKAILAARKGDSLKRFLFTWAATIFVFYTISSAKLPHYILPVIAPLALLAASSIAEKPKSLARNPQVVAGVGIVLLLLLDAAQRSWYVSSGQSEAHALALKHPEISAVYRLSRQSADKQTGSTKLQETSLPSLVMLLNKPLAEEDEPAEIPEGATVFTRKGRVAPSSGWQLLDSGKNFEIWSSKNPISPKQLTP